MPAINRANEIVRLPRVAKCYSRLATAYWNRCFRLNARLH